ncbi:MAG: bifunctional pyr operon transcriptional regulator/uracil phosphoribosyltransferase PyrR [Candidatus Omnitrophica bacterium]|jgi:pyrimidine operon attenuation protein/uracil phosphoribosyltransferase|nr:bifunctional pyr operon transcriptional regulator/uracil phosphoribosyltransferase PyrR [Candidatus Omnitrophota bacterium]
MASKILDTISMQKLLKDIAIKVKNELKEDFIIIGIQRRGRILAERLKNILEKEGITNIPIGFLDITLYRDDFSKIGHNPIVSGTNILFDIENKRILLIDDVLFTGRTIRAALDELMDFGRPKEVKLLVLIDRDNRELPIQPDFVGLKTVVDKNQMVEVRVKEIDGVDEVVPVRIKE